VDRRDADAEKQPVIQNCPSACVAFGNIQFGAKKSAFATAEPLSPSALSEAHFCPKEVCAGALSVGCQRRAMLRLANETRFCADR
jgi:hypothetical protein